MGPNESWHRIGTGSLRFAYQHNHFDPDLCGADCLSLLFMSLIHAALARRLSRNLTPCPLAVAINVWAGRHVNQTSREDTVLQHWVVLMGDGSLVLMWRTVN